LSPITCASPRLWLLCILSCARLSDGREPAGAALEDMVLIPAGRFVMGTNHPKAMDEGPQHRVYLSPYHMDKCEVTNSQFAAFVQATGHLTAAERPGAVEAEDGISWRHPEGRGSTISTREHHPVVYVSWDDARAYCAWRGKRLPTEAEWEKSARGTDGRMWPWGNAFGPEHTNLWGAEDGYGKTAPVGSFPAGASPHGVLDLAGNVWEWCADWYGEGYYTSSPRQNPPGPDVGQRKILRGGSWINRPATLRTSNRFEVLPVDRSPYIGFRCARSE